MCVCVCLVSLDADTTASETIYGTTSSLIPFYSIHRLSWSVCDANFIVLRCALFLMKALIFIVSPYTYLFDGRAAVGLLSSHSISGERLFPFVTPFRVSYM